MPIILLIVLGLVLLVLALWLIAMLLWLAFALLVRIIAWVLVALIVSFAGGLVCGVLRGVVLPPGVLGGRVEEVPRIATPDAVVDGSVLGRSPLGATKGFGWDHAWPVYLPHQAVRDANAVLAAAKRIGFAAFAALVELGALGLLFLPAVAGFVVGVWTSILAWYLVMGVLGGAAYLAQKLGVLGYRWFDHLSRRLRKADLRCAKCYRVTVVPSYRCAGATCGTVHHDLRPGPLGIVHRRCGCGTRIPAAVGGAARHLVTVCPFCAQDAPEGSGTRRVLPLPVIGAVSAGKTQFLTSGVVELRDRVKARSGSLTPISPVAEEFLRTAAGTVFSGKRVGKTAWNDRPEGAPLILSLGEREIEVQIMDAAGENFVGRDRSQALGYIDTAGTLLFVLDPLALPAVKERLRRAQEEDAVSIAQGDQEDAYASVVDRLRAEGVRMRAKRLAVVMTKFDVLHQLPDNGVLDPADSGSIEEWLKVNGARGLVRRIEHDFQHVDYFAVDSRGTREGIEPFHPVRVLDRVLRTADPGLAVLSRPETAPTGEEKYA